MRKWRANYQSNTVKKRTFGENQFKLKKSQVKEIGKKILDILPPEDSKKELEDILVLEDLNFELLAKIDVWKKLHLHHH